MSRFHRLSSNETVEDLFGLWTVAYCPMSMRFREFQERSDPDERRRGGSNLAQRVQSPGETSSAGGLPKRLHLYSLDAFLAGGCPHARACPMRPSGARCRSVEAGIPPPPSSPTRLLPQAGGLGSFTLVYSPTGAVEAVPRHSEIPNLLARKICRSLSIPEIGG